MHGIGGVEEESGEMFGGGGGKEFSSQEEVVFGMVSAGYQVHNRDRLGVPREQRMRRGHLPRVIYHQVYSYTQMKKNDQFLSAQRN